MTLTNFPIIEYFKAALQGFYNHFFKHIISVLTIWLVCSGQLAVWIKLVLLVDCFYQVNQVVISRMFVLTSWLI